jgi:hypothetical protein
MAGSSSSGDVIDDDPSSPTDFTRESILLHAAGRHPGIKKLINRISTQQ